MRLWIASLLSLSCLACGHPPAENPGPSEASLSFTLPFEQTPLFPQKPDESMTPGSLCDNPDSQRYPEQINYCRRNVSKSTKKYVIKRYDSELNYQVGTMNRGDFKIDHLIPLCMGGSNEVRNLWPQHRSIYNITDKLEERLCIALSKALLTQREAVEKILNLKRHLELAPVIQKECDDLIGDEEDFFAEADFEP